MRLLNDELFQKQFGHEHFAVISSNAHVVGLLNVVVKYTSRGCATVLNNTTNEIKHNHVNVCSYNASFGSCTQQLTRIKTR